MKRREFCKYLLSAPLIRFSPRVESDEHLVEDIYKAWERAIKIFGGSQVIRNKETGTEWDLVQETPNVVRLIVTKFGQPRLELYWELLSGEGEEGGEEPTKAKVSIKLDYRYNKKVFFDIAEEVGRKFKVANVEVLEEVL